MWSYELFDRASAMMLVIRLNGEPIGALTFRNEQKAELDLWISQINLMNRTKREQPDGPKLTNKSQVPQVELNQYGEL